MLYVVSLAKRLTDCIGFIPRGAVEEKLSLGRYWIAEENGEPAGFIYHGSLASPFVRIFQVAVADDARRLAIGSKLVDRVAARAHASGSTGLSLRCLSRLPANDFWGALAFRVAHQEPGGASRGDVVNVWQRRLPTKSLLPFKEELRT